MRALLPRNWPERGVLQPTQRNALVQRKRKKRSAADDARAEAREYSSQGQCSELRTRFVKSASNRNQLPTSNPEFEQGKRELLETEQPPVHEAPVTPARWKVGSAVADHWHIFNGNAH
jgi:hypothetical protein